MNRNTLRVAAVLAMLSIMILFGADLLHGGMDPANLQSVLPEYADNLNWKAVHLAQFIGSLMAIGSAVILLNHIRTKSGSVFALLGLLTAFVAASTYAANQAVDGVAIQFVAQNYVNAAPTDQNTAFQIAEAVRHIEQGLSSLAALNLSLTILLGGLAIITTDVVTRGLGWGALIAGGAYLVFALALNFLGFSEHILGFWVTNLLAVWLIAMGVVLWRESSKAPILTIT